LERRAGKNPSKSLMKKKLYHVPFRPPITMTIPLQDLQTRESHRFRNSSIDGVAGNGWQQGEKGGNPGKGRRKTNTFGLKIVCILPKAHSKRI
jgi:hypothetical protein